jgi:hypothetical protein
VVVPAAQVTVTGPTTLTFVTPPHAAGVADVVVTTPGGTSSALPFRYDAVAPVVTGISPATGPTGGGTTVTVTGDGFVPGGTTVTIGGVVVPADQVTVVSPTTLTFVTPAGVAGTVGIAVTTDGGRSTELPFRYTDGLTSGGVVTTGGPTGSYPYGSYGYGYGPSSLAFTGADLALPVVGGGLALLVGAALLLGGRRRSDG